jgi:hypothetical protein
MTSEIGESDYRRGGLERLRESGILLEREMFAGSCYLGGRAVESMLRALVWRNDVGIRRGKKSLETGHDLRELLTLVSNLGVLADDEHRNELAANVQYIARLWFNNMRFVPTEKIKSLWWDLREIRQKRTLKRASEDFYNACSSIVKRCEVLCRN